MNGRRIAVVEDDAVQRELLLEQVRGLGAVAEPFSTGEHLLKSLRRESFDLLVLDWQLPGLQGPDIVRSVRAGPRHDTPIIFVTNRSLESDIVAALQAGADDYVVKPIRPAEFRARIQALLRRAYPQPQQEQQRFGPYVFDMVHRIAHLHDQAVDLQPREFDLALFLFNNLGRLLSRAHLIQGLWHSNSSTLSRSLDTHVSRLRTKLNIGPATGYRLSSVYGIGYRLDPVDPLAVGREDDAAAAG